MQDAAREPLSVNTTIHNDMRTVMQHRPLIYACIGGSVSLLDTALFHLIGVRMHVNDYNAMPWLAAFFCTNFALMGFFIGRLKDSKLAIEDHIEALAKSKTAELDALSKSLDLEHLATLGRLSASIAHEVRNPLGVMRASASMISEDTHEMPETQTAAHFIRDEVDRLDVFVQSLLQYARPTPVTPLPCSSDTIAQRLGDLVHDPRVNQRWPEEAIALHTDPDSIVRILHNLLLNALHFTDEDTGDVSLDTTTTATTFSIHIRDNGPGIDEADQSMLFEPFFTTRTQGTGLGLATSKLLANSLGATLHHHDDTTDGAHFSLTILR